MVLSSHYMDEVEALAQNVAVLARGAGRGHRATGVARRSRPGPGHHPLHPSRRVDPRPSACPVGPDAESGTVEIDTDDEIPVLATVTNWALDRGVGFRGLSVTRETLEDIYLDLTAVGDARRPDGPDRSSRPRRTCPRGSSGDLRLVAHEVRYEQLAFWVNRVGAVFTVGFSVVFLVLLGASAGNSRISYLGNIKLIQYYVPGFVAYGVMAACFTTLAINLVVRRETGLLKRLRLSPLPTWALLTAIFISTAIVAFVQVVLLLVIGRFGYGVDLPESTGRLRRGRPAGRHR